jgi:hypothetical protein
MRNWLFPLTVLGLGGIGALVLSERGRETLHNIVSNIDEAPEKFADLNDTVQRELASIESALNQLAESLHAGFSPEAAR